MSVRAWVRPPIKYIEPVIKGSCLTGDPRRRMKMFGRDGRGWLRQVDGRTDGGTDWWKDREGWMEGVRMLSDRWRGEENENVTECLRRINGWTDGELNGRK